MSSLDVFLVGLIGYITGVGSSPEIYKLMRACIRCRRRREGV